MAKQSPLSFFEPRGSQTSKFKSPVLELLSPALGLVLLLPQRGGHQQARRLDEHT